uniref:Amine oxidase domain-containing protein n=1 Tax=Chromera velia CCMP2878 TaxID=1169474 RepID=A0A0G4G4Y4_9ALVE|eukprot:Cvel_539.t1-p1 / transcript=Cvel_539.t1 / gene=Cvel_539 / organism=Chromera_velia_CCMP2878 / gene_product=Probable polyamine oxidase 5, putative / transcript_product=Probable polyamine oxidase 5, putative / location=Cvel_scaffold17:4988-7159(+) / protein_length=724 / sequence_SO=supercontig / SO=protein_coding / is_pseudo=false
MFSTECETFDVIVLGLGLAGLGACEELEKSGAKWVALEAGDRVGGRVHSCRLPHNDHVSCPILEFGATWVHGGEEGNAAFRLAQRFGLLKKEKETGEDAEKAKSEDGEGEREQAPGTAAAVSSPFLSSEGETSVGSRRTWVEDEDDFLDACTVGKGSRQESYRIVSPDSPSKQDLTLNIQMRLADVEGKRALDATTVGRCIARWEEAMEVLYTDECRGAQKDQCALSKVMEQLAILQSADGPPKPIQPVEDERVSVMTTTHERKIYGALYILQCLTEGSPDMRILSSRLFSDYTELDGPHLKLHKLGGMQELPNRVAAELNDAVEGNRSRLRLRHLVRSVSWAGSSSTSSSSASASDYPIVVEALDTSSSPSGVPRRFACRRVVVTFSLGVLKASIEMSANSQQQKEVRIPEEFRAPQFFPSLPPWKARAVSSLGMGIVEKVYVCVCREGEAPMLKQMLKKGHEGEEGRDGGIVLCRPKALLCAESSHLYPFFAPPPLSLAEEPSQAEKGKEEGDPGDWLRGVPVMEPTGPFFYGAWIGAPAAARLSLSLRSGSMEAEKDAAEGFVSLLNQVVGSSSASSKGVEEGDDEKGGKFVLCRYDFETGLPVPVAEDRETSEGVPRCISVGGETVSGHGYLLRSQWGTDPRFRGAYSFPQLGCTGDEVSRLACPVSASGEPFHSECGEGEGRLFFAGEACNGSFFGTMHGAWESGVEAGGKVVASLGGK